MHRSSQRLLVILAAIALVFPFTRPTSANGPLTARTLDRDADAVIVAGAAMPGFGAAPLNRLFVYAYRGGHRAISLCGDRQTGQLKLLQPLPCLPAQTRIQPTQVGFAGGRRSFNCRPLVVAAT